MAANHRSWYTITKPLAILSDVAPKAPRYDPLSRTVACSEFLFDCGEKLFQKVHILDADTILVIPQGKYKSMSFVTRFSDIRREFGMFVDGTGDVANRSNICRRDARVLSAHSVAI